MNFSIISEYNPFHNGHKYQIDTIKNKLDGKNIIVIQSGNFVQRGDVSIASKFTRAKMALLSGADIILEIPQIFSSSSAMYFSKGSISVLDRLNIIDKICFGSENTTTDTLENISKFLINEPTEFSELIKTNMTKGFSYPKSRSLALEHFGYGDTIKTPNNILGVEYIKSLYELNSNIEPVTINRTNDFHEKNIKNNVTSATSIRENIDNLELIKDTIPDICFDIFKEDINKNKYDINNLSSIFHYAFISKQKSEILKIVDMNEHLYNRLYEVIKTNFLITDIINSTVSKNYTQTRINRVILNIILDNKQEELNNFTKNGFPFVRVLGFRKEKQYLLKEMIEKSNIKIITNLKNADKILSADEMKILSNDIKKSNYFLLSNSNKSQNLDFKNFENQLVII